MIMVLHFTEHRDDPAIVVLNLASQAKFELLKFHAELPSVALEDLDGFFASNLARLCRDQHSLGEVVWIQLISLAVTTLPLITLLAM